MKITDEMLQVAMEEAVSAGLPGNVRWDDMRGVLDAVAPLICAAYGQQLLDHAWDGPSRGAIRGAIDQLENGQDGPPLLHSRYRPAHGVREQ